jgi:DNA primase
MRRPDWYINQVRERTSIADYAGKRLTWDRKKSRPAAGDYWAPCPFHTERTASFHVRDKEGTFKCFGCGEGGNVFKLCQKLEGLDFIEAVDKLAREAGIAPPDSSPQEQAAQDERARLLRAMAKAHGLYRRALLGAEGAGARAYLEGRGLGPAVWEQFAVGFAPDGWTWLIDALGKDGVRREDMFAAGLAREGGRDGAVDLFRNRILFPIADPQGRIVAFGGRALRADDKTPKYVNSPETEIYHKGRTLYRLKEARELLARTKAAGFVVAEGYLDVVAFERAGVAAVAALGTALTEEQLLLAWKSGGAPILCFDGDAAGRRAADKALDVALPHLGPERTVRIALLPGGLDPDDVFRADGPAALAGLLEAAQPAAEALFERERARRAIDTPEARADLSRRLQAAAGRIADPATRRHYARDLADRAWALFRAAPRQAGKGGRRRQEPAGPAQPTDELKLLAKLPRAARVEGIVRFPVEHPHVLAAGADLFAQIEVADRDLDLIRHAILDLWSATHAVDREALAHHLLAAGAERARERVLRWPAPAARRPSGSLGVSGAPLAVPGVSERERHDTEAEWMAMLALDVAGARAAEEIEEARRGDLDGDEEAFRAALEAARARRKLQDAALARGQEEFDAPPWRS